MTCTQLKCQDFVTFSVIVFHQEDTKFTEYLVCRQKRRSSRSQSSRNGARENDESDQQNIIEKDE